MADREEQVIVELPFEEDNPNDITVKDAARTLQRHPNTVRKWIEQGLLPAYKTKGIHSSRTDPNSYELRVRVPLPDQLVFNTAPVVVTRPKENMTTALASELERTKNELEAAKSQLAIHDREARFQASLDSLDDRLDKLTDSYKAFFEDYKQLKQQTKEDYEGLTDKLKLLAAPKPLPWYKRVFAKR